jgi:chromosome segregation ATPase
MFDLQGELERVRLRVSELLPLEELAESLRDQVAQGAQKEAAKEQRIAELEVASEAQKVAAERKVDEARRESKEKVEKVMQVRLDKLQAELDATKSKLSKAEDERTAARKEVAVLEEKLRDAVEELRTAKEGDLSCEAVLGAIGTWSPAKRVKPLSVHPLPRRVTT